MRTLPPRWGKGFVSKVGDFHDVRILKNRDGDAPRLGNLGAKQTSQDSGVGG